MFWKFTRQEGRVAGKNFEDFDEEAESKKDALRKNNTDSLNIKRLEEAPRWVEVEGYKAVTYNMESFHGKEKYQVGETKKYEGVIRPCKAGYHFGATLQDVVNFYPPRFGTRYFKVKGIVPASSYFDADNKLHIAPKTCGRLMWEVAIRDYKLTGGLCKPEFSDYLKYSWKFVAKEITFLEEIPLEEIAVIKSPFDSVIETEEEYYNIRTIGNFYKLAYKKWNNAAKNTFSEGFCNYIFCKIGGNTLKTVSSNYDEDRILNIYNKLAQALAAVKDEQITQDMKVALFLQLVEDKLG